MKIRLARRVFKHLVLVMLTPFIIISSEANAQKLASGLVQIVMEAEIWPSTSITTATCSASLSLVDTRDTSNILAFSSDTTIEATINSNFINCTVIVPYYWTVSSLNGTIGISYTMSAQNGTAVTKTTSGNFVGIPASTTGTTTKNVATFF
jgi:hypothetical protein